MLFDADEEQKITLLMILFLPVTNEKQKFFIH